VLHYPGLRALLIDLDETLLDDDRGMQKAAGLAASDLAARHSSVDATQLAETYIARSYGFWASLGAVPTSTGLGSGTEIRLVQWGQTLAAVDLPTDLAEEVATFYAAARRETYTLFDDALPFLEAVSGQMPVALLTNGAGDTQREKLRVTGLDRFLTEVFVSGDIGWGKPAPEAFAFALRKLGVQATEAAHLGDSLANDVEGARLSGLKALWIDRRGEEVATPPGVLRVATLADLLG
jgi:putative hydrolase of the HAD superfamily